jgi:hypothetical protein
LQSTANIDTQSRVTSLEERMTTITPVVVKIRGPATEVVTTAPTAAALDSSKSNGFGSSGPQPPLFTFTELKAVVSSGRAAVTSAAREFVFSPPEPAAMWQPDRAMAAHTAAKRHTNSSSAAVAGKLNNGHGQFSACASSESLSSSNCLGSTAFALGTSGRTGVAAAPAAPLVNFKSAAMPDVTNNAKLTKGVQHVQGKQSFNKLFGFKKWHAGLILVFFVGMCCTTLFVQFNFTAWKSLLNEGMCVYVVFKVVTSWIRNQ